MVEINGVTREAVQRDPLAVASEYLTRDCQAHVKAHGMWSCDAGKLATALDKASATLLPAAVAKMPVTASVTVEVRNVFGCLKAYPVCERARAFARIAGSTTLTKRTLLEIAGLGFVVVSCANADWSACQ